VGIDVECRRSEVGGRRKDGSQQPVYTAIYRFDLLVTGTKRDNVYIHIWLFGDSHLKGGVCLWQA
jgi:hypothetical protein